tara:strand:- start:303 stop:497 length:195 start_codon:yes stop_codon:yes gene_type:complete
LSVISTGRFTSKDRVVDLYIFKTLRVNLIRVISQNCEIRMFADFNGPKSVISVQYVRRINSDRA